MTVRTEEVATPSDDRPSELPRESLPARAPLRAPRPAVLAAAVAVLAAAVFAIAYGGPWIYDDHTLVERNGWIQSFTHWKRWFATDFWDVNEEANRYAQRIRYWRPLITATYAVDWALGGGSTAVFHLTNLLWQALVAFLAFRALLRWLGRPMPAFVAALLFALHPTKAESVAWIAGRTDVVCTAALLLVAEAVALRLRARTPRARGVAIALEVLATALAYGTKEQSIVVPAFVAIEAWTVLGRGRLDRRGVTLALRAALPQLALAIGYVVLRRYVLPLGAGDATVPLGERARMVLESFGRYAAASFWPVDLSVQKALLRTVNLRIVFHPGYMALGAAILIGLPALAFAARRRAPKVSLGLAFYLATLVPTANVIPTGMVTLVADRFLYLPLLGLAFAAAAAVELLPELHRRAGLLVLGGGAVVLGAASIARSADFLDEREFWAREARLHPESIEAIRFELEYHTYRHEFRAALRKAAEGQRIAAEHFAPSGWESSFVVYGVRLLATLTPDADAQRLQAIARFAEEVADPRSTTVRLELPDVELVVSPRRGPAGARLQGEMPRIRMLRADISSRLGDDALALALAREVSAGCAACREVAHAHAMIAARAGRYDEAFQALDDLRRREAGASVSEDFEVLRRAALAAKQAAAAPEGPLQVNLRATELASLDAWGRAYGLLAPYKELIKRAPGMAYGFAELAYRAGYTDVAREMLSVLIPPEKIAPTEHEWARRMGWTEDGPGEAAPPAKP